MNIKILGLLLIIGSISFSQEGISVHDLKMKMELDKSKVNHIVVNIVEDQENQKNQEKTPQLEKPNAVENQEKIPQLEKSNAVNSTKKL